MATISVGKLRRDQTLFRRLKRKGRMTEAEKLRLFSLTSSYSAYQQELLRLAKHYGVKA